MLCPSGFFYKVVFVIPPLLFIDLLYARLWTYKRGMGLFFMETTLWWVGPDGKKYTNTIISDSYNSHEKIYWVAKDDGESRWVD